MRHFVLGIACLSSLFAGCSADAVSALTSAVAADPPGANVAARPATASPAPAVPAGKRDLTPTFYQLDTDAGFENGGENYCAPTAVSGGLIYLAIARNLKDLVPGTDHAGQVTLVKQLAEHMNTDPDEGTPPAGIITGLQSYAAAHAYSVRRLEVAGWRSLGAENSGFKIGLKPELAWLRAAADDPDTVTLLNVGWYRAENGGYVRHGGHWVNVVGSGAGTLDFELRNPGIKAADQTRKTSVTLTALDGDFSRVDNSGNSHDMSGYYKVSGPGLPFGTPTAAAVIDGVMVFTLSK